MAIGGGAGRHPNTAAGASECAVLRGIRCLLVEDYAFVAQRLEQLLRRAGATTVSASTVAEACLALTEHVFDLVLLDLNLGGENGMAVAKAARGLPSPPVVFVVTGDPAYLDLGELAELGTKVMMKVNIGGGFAGMLRAVLDEQRGETVPPRSRATNARTSGVHATGDTKRRAAPAPGTPAEGSEVWLDFQRGELRGPAALVLLTESQVRLLRFLSESGGAWSSLPALSLRVFGRTDGAAHHLVAQHVRNLRRKFEAAGVPATIETRRGFGYRMRFEALAHEARTDLTG